MPITAIALDEDNIQHLVVGLNREDVNSIVQGDVLTLPSGIRPAFTEESDIVVLFAETDEELASRFPSALRPV